MSNNDAGAKNDCPTDRRTDGPHGQERDHSTDDESGAESRYQTGDSAPPAGDTSPAHEYPRGSTRRTVVAWLVENVDGLRYIKSSQIAADLTLSANQVGCALGKLVDDDLPVEIERWDSSSNRATWRVEPKREVVADGGTAFESADEAAEALDGVIDAAEPALSEDERATATAVSQFLAREDEGYTPIERRLKDISDEIRSGHALGEVAYFGDIGVHTFFDPEGGEMPVGETTLLLMAFDNLTEELWLDEDIVRDHHGEVSAETVAAEVESQCEEFISQFRAFERLAGHVEEVYREFENADNTEGDDA
jgi:hypothetical protein